MIKHLSGTVLHFAPGQVVLSCHGVGYLVRIADTAETLAVGAKADFWTHLRVREDALDLYGFANRNDLELFESLQKIRGFPAKAALEVVGRLGAQGLQKAISDGDIKVLTSIPGIGKKLAQQLLLDLRGKINLEDWASKGPTEEDDDDAVLALIELGFAPAEARKKIKSIREENKTLTDTAEILRLALKKG